MRNYDDEVAELPRRLGIGETVPELEARQKARGRHVDPVSAAVPLGAPTASSSLDAGGDDAGEGDGLYEAHAAALAAAIERAAG